MKTTSFNATYYGPGEDYGKKFKWSFYRDGKHGWFLRDYNGYERCLEKTWRDSIPVIKRILSNHNMEAEIS